MDKELTKTDVKSSDHRIACADDQTNSPIPPNRARKSDHQGAQFGCPQIGSIWSTTVVALRIGGASRSKWTRKTRPWNASLRATVVASISIEEPQQERLEFMPKPPYGAVGSNGVLRPSGRRRWQGNPRENPATKVPARAAASSTPPSIVRMGGGDRDSFSAVITWMRRPHESRS